jgi:hypothetical protein
VLTLDEMPQRERRRGEAGVDGGSAHVAKLIADGRWLIARARAARWARGAAAAGKKRWRVSSNGFVPVIKAPRRRCQQADNTTRLSAC